MAISSTAIIDWVHRFIAIVVWLLLLLLVVVVVVLLLLLLQQQLHAIGAPCSY